MPNERADIGQEILEGIREIKRGEQGRRAPSGAAQTLLRIAARNPQALIEFA